MAILRLYHRTSRENAARIAAERKMLSEENTGEAYFSTVENGQASGYGDAVVCIEIPEDLAEIDDEFPDGEQHYRVKVSAIRPEYFRF